MSIDWYDPREDRPHEWDYEEQQRLLDEYGEPGDPFQHLINPDPATKMSTTFGFIADNDDPLESGRVMVYMPELDMGDPKTPLGWFPLIRPNTGFGILPGIGEKVIIIFLDDNPNCPVVYASMYTQQNRPDPAVKTDRHQIRFSTPSGSVLAFHEEKGKESIELSAHKGKMRLIIDAENGIEITNELGEIHIECKELITDSEDFLVETKKECQISAGEINIEASKGIKLESAKEVSLKASKIKLQGNSVTAGGKPVASHSDQAIGIDMHTIMVPSNSGLQPMPNVPHPFLGKLKSKLSTTVTFGERAIATKGSEAVMPDPGHIPMPPGVKFQQTPKGKGKITGGCVDKVKVDGKPIAVIGSTVTSCSDTGQQDHIQVISAGSPAILPIMMPGMDPDQYKRDGGTMFDTRDLYSKEPRDTRYLHPKMQNPQWSVGKAKAGEEVTLSVDFENQYPECTAYFDIYREGDNPEKDPPVKKLWGQNKDGKAKTKWSTFLPDGTQDKNSEEQKDVKLFFQVSAFKCGKLKGPEFTLEVEKPEFSELEWNRVEYDKDGKPVKKEKVEKAEYGTTVLLSAKVKNLKDGKNVNVYVYEHGYKDPEQYLVRKLVEIKDGMVHVDWDVLVTKKRLLELTKEDKLRFVFAIETPSGSVRSKDSEGCQASFTLREYVDLSEGSQISDGQAVLESEDKSYSKTIPIPGGTQQNERLLLEFKDVLPGNPYKLTIKHVNQQDRVWFDKVGFTDLFYSEGSL